MTKLINPIHMNRTRIALAIGLACISVSSQAEVSLTDAIKTGKASVNERLRFESVDDDAFKKEAKAFTLRSRIGYETAPFYGFTVLSEFEDIHVVGGFDDYQLPAPPKPVATEEAVIADPEMTELNRFQLRYRGISRLDLTLGRQRIIFDNHRFIGNVGFRQDEQTYDAFSAVYTGINDLTLSYSYVDHVNGFSSTDDKHSVFDADTSDNLINIAYNGFTWGKFILYSYNLHNQNETLKGSPLLIDINPGLRYITNVTSGLRFDGAYILPTTVPLKAIYRAEYAKQTAEQMEGAASPTILKSHDVDYKLVEAGMTLTLGNGAYALTPMIGYEVLGSDKGLYGLQTPYATKHAFNGWADQFLVTPNEGLQDKYFTLGFDFNNPLVKTMLQFHVYDSDAANLATKKDVDFGSETGLSVTKSIGANWILGTKYAEYNTNKDEKALSKKLDADKLWAWVELNF